LKRLCGNCEKVYDDAHASVKYYHVPGAAVDPVPVRLCPYCGCPEHSGVPNNQWEKRFHKVDYVKVKEGVLKVSTVKLLREGKYRLVPATFHLEIVEE